MKHIRVSCAIIESDGAVLAAQRGSAMNMPLKWEFPGGKIEPQESAEACLVRELVEEMGVGIAVRRALSPVTYSYPTLCVTLFPFVCDIISGEPQLHEHAAMAWLPPQELLSLDWCEADLPVVAEYLQTVSLPQQ